MSLSSGLYASSRTQGRDLRPPIKGFHPGRLAAGQAISPTPAQGRHAEPGLNPC